MNELSEWIIDNGLHFDSEEEAEQAYADAKREWLEESYAMEDYYLAWYGE